MSRSYAKLSVFALSILAAACSQQVDGDEHESQSEELRRIGVDPLPPIVVGGGGGGTVVKKRTTPRVVARSASGNTLRVTFDRALEAGEVPLGSTEVLVVRKSGSGFATRNLRSGASMSADKRTLSFAMTENIRSGESYHPRGRWQPCSGSTSGFSCKERPAQFGVVYVKSARTAALDLAAVGPIVLNRTLFAANVAAPPATAIVLADEPAPPTQGTFRVKRVTPSEAAVDVSRNLQEVVVEFEGGTVDCSRTGRGKETFHLYSVDPNRSVQQSMYNVPGVNTPAGGDYRGRLLCEETENRIKFITPGILSGGSRFQIDLDQIWSREGNLMTGKVIPFETQRPGLQVRVSRVENHYGGDNTCDDDWIGANYCDVYVTTASASAGANLAARLPEVGDFSGMRDFRADAIHGSRDINPLEPIFFTSQPINEEVQLQMWAYDADSDSAWKGIFDTASKIAAAASSALLPIQPQYGAIAGGVAAGFAGLAAIIPSNEDDLMGSVNHYLTRDTQRWGTEAGRFYVDLSKNHPDRGPVRVFLYSEEVPRSWAPAPIIL
jgi:hypothetical protein